jgi:hypothetical protein
MEACDGSVITVTIAELALIIAVQGARKVLATCPTKIRMTVRVCAGCVLRLNLHTHR